MEGLLSSVRRVMTRRSDNSMPVFRALELLTVDLCVAVACCRPHVFSEHLRTQFLALWRPVEQGGVIPKPHSLDSVLSSRTLMIIGQNPTQAAKERA